MRGLKKEEIEYALGRLDAYMTSRGLNQNDLDALSGVEQSTISKILHRKQEPSLENLQRLFGGLGLQLADVLRAAADRLPKVLRGYLATPLTGLTEQEDESVRGVVEAVRRCADAAEFSNLPLSIYWPGEHTHPKQNPKYKATTVYLIDRSRASTFHFLVILCGAPSYGVGQENEIATQAGVPAIRLVNSQVSRSDRQKRRSRHQGNDRCLVHRRPMSLLVERFAAVKASSKSGVAEDEIIHCVKALRRRLGLRAVAPFRLELFLTSRNIRDVATDDDLKADGALVPLGSDFSAGFRMVLRRDLPEGRINFTVAHEICHTFFYERVPEIKFGSHPVDPEEERLCNFGAEELLMPGRDVKRLAKEKPVSLEALQELASHYRVSIPAMLIRLRNLGLWKAELVLWHQMTNGTFSVKRLWGGKMVDWRWLDTGIPRAALSEEKTLTGHTFWLVTTEQGEKFKPIRYQVKRHRGDLLALVLKKQKKKPQKTTSGQSEFFSRVAAR